MSFLREAFSDGGEGSASRLMMGFHALVGAAGFGHVVIHTHALPDAMTMAGLTAFVTAPYAINAVHRAIDAIGAKQNPPGQ
jgi:hypothetical protein